MAGALIALLSAMAFGLNDAITRRGVLTGSPFQAMAISVPVGAAIFLIVCAAAGELGAVATVGATSAMFLALGGIVHFVLGRYCNYRSLQAIGANLAGPVMGTSSLLSVLLALLFLGEHLSGLKIFGIALVLGGPALLLKRRRRPPSPAPEAATTARPVFRPRLVEGYGFAVGSAVFYGTSPVLVRAGFEAGAGFGTGGSALLGGVISYLAATALVAAILLLPGTLVQVVATKRSVARLFTVTGTIVALAQMLRYVALALAPVTVVTPIVYLSSVLRTLIGWAINRDVESFEGHVLAAIGVSFVGVAALTIDAELLLGLAALPDWLTMALRWRWPGS